MNSLKLFPFMEREQILSDINKAIVPGVYGILNNRLDNLPITDWFVLIVISWRYYVVQIAYSLIYLFHNIFLQGNSSYPFSPPFIIFLKIILWI